MADIQENAQTERCSDEPQAEGHPDSQLKEPPIWESAGIQPRGGSNGTTSSHTLSLAASSETLLQQAVLNPRAPWDEQAGTVVCEICCEIVVRSDMHGCSGCTHRYCRSCIGTFWHAAIFSGRHNHVPCICGGCTVAANDDDIAAVVTSRTFARMQFFRSRDRNADKPHVRWCPTDGCWQEITDRPAPNATHVDCPDCKTRVCYKCGLQDIPDHFCLPRGPSSPAAATIDACTFHVWAFCHTKTCPSCHARIQRNKGCSHMTCSRCSAYFCWRCRGYLKCGSKLQGRPCMCDAIIGTVVYSGLFVVGLAGAPIVIAGALIGAGPYAIYRYTKRRRARNPEPRNPLVAVTSQTSNGGFRSRADLVSDVDSLTEELSSILSNTAVSHPSNSDFAVGVACSRSSRSDSRDSSRVPLQQYVDTSTSSRDVNLDNTCLPDFKRDMSG